MTDFIKILCLGFCICVLSCASPSQKASEAAFTDGVTDALTSGQIDLEYDELERRCTEAIELSPGGPVVALNIPIGQWHTVRALESGTVIMEVKDGPYEPTGEEDILISA